MRRFTLFHLTVVAFIFIGHAYAQTNYDTSPNGQTGVQMFGSYFATDIDTVGLYNGNLHLSIPLFSLPGRELPYGLSLTYNAQKWETDGVFGTDLGRYEGGWIKSNVFGNKISFWVDGDESFNHCSVFWIDGAGTKHKYDQNAEGNCYPAGFDNRTFTSMDSDGSTLYTGTYNSNGSTPARINFKNGHVLYFHTPTSRSTVPWDYVTPNGNYLIKSSNESGLPTQDTLGRSVGYTCSTGCGANSWTETYTVTDSNNQSQTYVLNWLKASSYQGTNFIDPIFWEHPAYQMTLLTSMQLPNGKTYTFEYANTAGMLTKVTLPSGAYFKYVYTGSVPERILERRVNVLGTTNTNDEQVWQYASSCAGGVCPPFVITVTSPEGDKVAHAFTEQGQEVWTESRTASNVVLKRIENTWTYTSIAENGQAVNGRVTTSKTYLNSTLSSTKDLTYDTTNMNLVQEKMTEGTGATGQVKNQKDITYLTISGNYKVPIQETLTAIEPVTGNFIPQGKTVYGYDEYMLTTRSGVPNHTGNTSESNRGNLTSIKHYKDATNFVTETMKYDSVGNVVEKIDPLNHSTLIDFTDNFTDTNKNGSKFAYPKKVTNALSQYVTSKYDFNTGLVKESTNLRGYTTTTAYDLMNRVTSITEPNGKQITYSYDDTNRITTKQVTVDTSGNVGRVKTYFDRLYRVIQTRTNDPEGEITVDAVYDGKGRKTKVSNPYRGVPPTDACTGIAICTVTTYDANDRPLTVTTPPPDSSVVKYDYNFNQTTVTDEAGNQRRYTYNPLGQMTKVEEPNPSLAWNTPIVTTYKYYGFGPLYRSDQSGQQRTFVYNWLSQMTTQTLPESGTTTFTYWDSGTLKTKADARNITTTINYDALNRPTSKTYSDSTPSVTWGYDTNGYTGLKTSMRDALSSTGQNQVSYSYDSMDRLTQESRALDNVATFSTGYAYNIKGDLTQLTYPSGRVVQFNYATGGGCCNSRLSSVVDQTTGATLTNGMTFNAAGETLTRTLNPGTNAIAESFQYNSRLQLTQISATSNSTSVMNFMYEYGTSSTNTGRVLSRTDSIQPEHSQTYTYDSIYRLSQAMSGDKTWSIGWTFDVWGNRTAQMPQGLATSKVGTQTSGYSNNRNTSFTFDSAGNQTNDGTHTYSFNAENQISQMDGGAATYAYDGDGRRMKKLTSTETTYTFYGPGGILCEFSTVPGTSTATAAGANDRTTYRTSDKLGSAVFFIASSGTVVENNRTLPYGESWLIDVNSVNDKKFTTYQRDQESGLDYAMGRYYANTVGRFVSVDKGPNVLHEPSTLNRYVYVIADPINNTDPDGNFIKPKPEPLPPIGPPIIWRNPFIFIIREREEQERERREQRIEESQAQAARLFDGISRALDKLGNRDCASLFNTTGAGIAGPREVLLDLYRGVSQGESGRWGYVDFGRRPRDENGVLDNATTSPEARHEYVNGVLTVTGIVAHISINTFAGTTLSEGADALANTLIHELGHVYGMFAELGGTRIMPDARDNPAASRANADMVSRACDH